LNQKDLVKAEAEVIPEEKEEEVKLNIVSAEKKEEENKEELLNSEVKEIPHIHQNYQNFLRSRSNKL